MPRSATWFYYSNTRGKGLNIEFLLFHGDVGGFCFGDSDANGVIDWLGTDYFKESENRYYTECKNKGIDYSVLCRDSLSELNIKKINTLVLNICESGNINFTNPNEWYNLAIGFISTQPYVQTVRGWNGSYCVSNNDLGFREYGVYDGNENIKGDEIKEYQSYDYYRNEYGEIVYLINDNIEQTGIYVWWGI